MFSRVAS